MSEILPGNPDDPDALPLNERSSAFIDGAAFVDFVRLKSRLAPQDGRDDESAATRADAGDVPKASSACQGNAVTPFTPDAAMGAEIPEEDWDSLFGAVEERLRCTVETLDSVTPQLDSRDKLLVIKSVVLDCVSSLDTLHQALRHDRKMHGPAGLDRDNAGI